MKEYLLIPSELCSYVINYRIVNGYKIYLWLQIYYSGKFTINVNMIQRLMKDLEFKSDKTVFKWIRVLKELDWIGYNKRSSIYFVRSFETIRKDLNFRIRSSAILYKSDLPKLKAFLIGVVISNLIRNQEGRKRRADLKWGRSKQLYRYSPLYFPVSLKVISKCLNVSISTAQIYKKLSESEGYIKCKNDYKILAEIPGNFKVQLATINNLRKSYPEFAHRMFIKENKILYQLPDLIYSSILFKKRKKLEHNNGDNKGKIRLNH